MDPPGGPQPSDHHGDTSKGNRYADTFMLAAKADSISGARDRVRRGLQRWGVNDDLTKDVVLVLSELATNAITHGAGARCHVLVALSLDLDGATLRVAVTDGDPLKNPTPRSPGVDDDSGRGLLLVGMLSTQWGTLLYPPLGKTVWAQFDLPDQRRIRDGGESASPQVSSDSRSDPDRRERPLH